MKVVASKSGLLTYADAAARFGIPESRLRDAVAQRTLRAVIFGHRTVRLRESDVEKWLSSITQEASV